MKVRSPLADMDVGHWRRAPRRQRPRADVGPGQLDGSESSPFPRARLLRRLLKCCHQPVGPAVRRRPAVVLVPADRSRAARPPLRASRAEHGQTTSTSPGEALDPWLLRPTRSSSTWRARLSCRWSCSSTRAMPFSWPTQSPPAVARSSRSRCARLRRYRRSRLLRIIRPSWSAQGQSSMRTRPVRRTRPAPASSSHPASMPGRSQPRANSACR